MAAVVPVKSTPHKIPPGIHQGSAGGIDFFCKMLIRILPDLPPGPFGRRRRRQNFYLSGRRRRQGFHHHGFDMPFGGRFFNHHGFDMPFGSGFCNHHRFDRPFCRNNFDGGGPGRRSFGRAFCGGTGALCLYCHSGSQGECGHNCKCFFHVGILLFYGGG